VRSRVRLDGLGENYVERFDECDVLTSVMAFPHVGDNADSRRNEPMFDGVQGDGIPFTDLSEEFVDGASEGQGDSLDLPLVDAKSVFIGIALDPRKVGGIILVGVESLVGMLVSVDSPSSSRWRRSSRRQRLEPGSRLQPEVLI
jgi:hypothetical protein